MPVCRRQCAGAGLLAMLALATAGCPGRGNGPAVAPAPAPTDPPITEITLQRRTGYAGPDSLQPVYQVVLRRDGTLTYRGIENVDRLGRFRARFDAYQFLNLEKLFNKRKFFELQDTYYGLQTTITVTSAVREGRRKSVTNAGRAPIDLWGIEMAVDGVLAGARDWSRVER